MVLQRTVRELNGIACIDLDEVPEPKQQIACTRSFGQPVTEMADFKCCIELASRAAQKLRTQTLAMAVLVFIRTSPFWQSDPQHARSTDPAALRPTSDTSRS